MIKWNINNFFQLLNGGNAMISKKLKIMFMLLLLISILVPTTVFADTGPKDSLTVYVKNPPKEQYYLDLLAENTGKYTNITDEQKDKLNKDMVKMLYSFKEDGWLPALVEGTSAPMWGKLTGDADGDMMVHKFGYVGLPDTYRIIIVTESGDVSVSEPLTRKALQSSVTYDFETGMAEVPSTSRAYLSQFLFTCCFTLLIEGVLLILFGFRLKENWKVFLITNVATQIVLTATVGVTLIKSGSLAAFLMQFPVELAILIFESIIFGLLLKGGTKMKRYGYGIAANIASWVFGFVMLKVFIM